MASVNKVILVDVSSAELVRMYVDSKMSIVEISNAIGMARSTIRFRLKRLGVLRSIKEATLLAGEAGKMSSMKGKTRVFSDEWKANISASAKARGEATAIGVSKKPNGYVEHTRGPHKGRSVHAVVMEAILGRPLHSDEIVHHKDHNRANNDPSNLELMTRRAHASLHATENFSTRKRASNGQFE